MISRAAVIWMLLAIAAGIGLFVLKYDVKSMEEKLARINSETLKNREEVHVLKAEWSYLNRPERLEDLGRRLLSLERMDASQTASIDDIPMRPDPNRPDTHAPDAREASKFARKNSPAAGHVPPLLATYKRAQ